MFRHTLAALAVAGLTGCAASVEPVGFGNRDQTPSAQMAAYAAAQENQYPQNVELSDDLAVAAVVNRDGKTLRIYNFSNQPLRDTKLWINETFVHRLDSVPANASIRVGFGELYDSYGHPFSQAQAPITSVQLQSGDDVYRVQGPAFE